MKESEAKEKVCPFIISGVAFTMPNPSIKVTRLAETLEPANINCIGGKCMAWQYTIWVEPNNKKTGIYKQTGYWENTSEKTNNGYCKRVGK